MKLTPEYWVVEDSKAIQITEEQMHRMVGYIAIFPSKSQALMFLTAWEKRWRELLLF